MSRAYKLDITLEADTPQDAVEALEEMTAEVRKNRNNQAYQMVSLMRKNERNEWRVDVEVPVSGGSGTSNRPLHDAEADGA